MGEGHYYHNISHITFKNNVFVHGWAWGLCVQDIPYLTAINNTFVDIAYHGIGLSGDSHHGTVKNNIFDRMETSYWFEDTWRIDYSPANGRPPSPVTGIANATRSYVLDGLTNYMLYTVTLTAVDGGSPIITATLQARPSDHLLILPVVFR